MSYDQDEREYFYASRPGYSSIRRNSYDGHYDQERRQPLPHLPMQDYKHEEYREKPRKSCLKLDQAPVSHSRAFQSPLPSPASTYSGRSSRASFSDYDEIQLYNPHQRALTFPQNKTKDDDFLDAFAEIEKRRKMRNKTLLYAGLACVTTVAASNNIYQSTKAHMSRRHEMQRGTMDAEAARKARRKGLKTDLLSLGVGAICINNAVKGWGRYEGLKKEEKKTDAELKKKRRAKREEEEYFESLR
ncbi:hypothetical protein GJ744_001841 [Endocarpon pusillum]|uniref:Uncharacterized protein n=1 Tax=Endocarpon pusillum TaxID=364733 RepID=A0A8H7AN90_9EURO|nr:hypothetical protein GJ744_001841 [Endocarpon pusillum]